MDFPKPTVTRKYGSSKSGPRPLYPSSSPASEVESHTPWKKRPFSDLLNGNGETPVSSKKPRVMKPQNGKKKQDTLKSGRTKPKMTQLHLAIDKSAMRTCSLCDLSYIQGAPDDESLHRTHCIRVQRGVEWGTEEERELQRSDDGRVIEENIQLRDGAIGSIICVRTRIQGRLGSKLASYLKTVNLALSAPDMTSESLNNSKVYLFLINLPGGVKKKIVGCVVAQPISEAMAIVAGVEGHSGDGEQTSAEQGLIHVEGNLFCHPERLPTPLGIPRLFVSSGCRRKGVAQRLLSAAARTFFHGCDLDPLKGQIAFSQPTSLGRAVMEKWGQGKVRVYEE